jgi:hypothetical protein
MKNTPTGEAEDTSSRRCDKRTFTAWKNSTQHETTSQNNHQANNINHGRAVHINILGQQKPWPGCTKYSEFNHGRAEYEENIPITLMDENIDHNTNQ